MTAGSIASTDPIRLHFVEDVLSGNIVEQKTKSPTFVFSPPINGQVKWLDRRTVIFEPSEPLKLRQSYSGTADLKAVFPERDDLEVDYSFPLNGTSLYLFGVKDSSKARLTTISCLEFIRHSLPFRSVIVHEDFDALPRKDRSRIRSPLPR